MADKQRKYIKRTLSALSVCLLSLFTRLEAFAFTITPDVTIDEFTKYTGDNIEGILLGTIFKICRIIGVVVFMWGIYSYISAKKDGEADSITVAIVKLVFGAVLFGMPSVLIALGLVIVKS